MRFLVRSGFAIVLAAVFAASAHATLTFYYDPLTGNVSMDTTNTRSGSLVSYGLSLSSMSFRPENFIRITNSTFFTRSTHSIGEGSFSDPWSGLYTIGDILPTGLTEAEWTSLFTFNMGMSQYVNEYAYSDVIGGGNPPPAEFVYGRPDEDFQNAHDLLDPDALDWADSATLRYFPATGNVTLATNGRDGGYITGFLLESEGAFNVDAYDPAFRVNAFDEASADMIFATFSVLRPGAYRLGNILETGLTQAELEATLTSAQFLSRAGFGGGNINIRALGTRLAVQVVPEPSTCALAGGLIAMALHAAVSRRR